MRARPSRSSPARRAVGFASLLALAAVGACSEEGPVAACRNCEGWNRLTAGLGRFPAPHPTKPQLVVFSTVDKSPGAPDANRESDEDLWLTWIVDPQDPSANPVWQLTGDELGPGDNSYPRWSPSGNEIAFVHTSPAGRFQVWRLRLTPPATPDDPTVVVDTTMYVSEGRDPAWVTDDRLVITRDDKLHAVGLPFGGAGVQLTFNPPLYASSEQYVDRHADFESGGGVFSTLGRKNVADIHVRAFEVDREVTPPETLATDAYILYQAPGGVASYPLFEGSDTLRTPETLRSIPVPVVGGEFLFGVRIDGRFLADSTRETYCDTTLTRRVRLVPGSLDTLAYHFEVARGTLRVRSMAPNTSVSWTRSDGLVSGGTLLVNPGASRRWPCLLSYKVVDGVPVIPPHPDSLDAYLETYLVSGSRAGAAPVDTLVRIPPGDTTLVVLYPAGPGIDTRELRPAGPLAEETSWSGLSRAPDALAGALSALRAQEDVGTVWRLALEGDRARFDRVFGSPGLIQNPAVSPPTPDGKRYVAYISDKEGSWDLYVQRVAIEGSGASERWLPDGSIRVATPGSVDNLDCGRNVFHPRISSGAAPGNLRILVAMSECPDNAFEDLGFDDDPWAIGEVRIWQVEIPVQSIR